MITSIQKSSKNIKTKFSVAEQTLRIKIIKGLTFSASLLWPHFPKAIRGVESAEMSFSAGGDLITQAGRSKSLELDMVLTTKKNALMKNFCHCTKY